ncbi:MAG: zinc ribbon domain-containing protein [Lachnospiraceae bacterium]|nr:zinc ribbon domain-containing protein [Lachnospiraceae bacterium]
MSFTGTVNAGMAKFTKSMKNGVDNCKADGKIAEQQKKIKVLTKEIGNLTLVRLEAGEEMCPEIMERYSAIKEAEEVISTLKREKIKTTVVCQKCGAKTSADMKYCGACGTSLKEA